MKLQKAKDAINKVIDNPGLTPEQKKAMQQEQRVPGMQIYLRLCDQEELVVYQKPLHQCKIQR
jgi:hypothetical protein